MLMRQFDGRLWILCLYLKFIISDDDQLLGPLPESLLPQQEGADATVSDRPVTGVLGRPSLRLVPPLAVLIVVLLVRLIGAAESIRVVIWATKAEIRDQTVLLSSYFW